MEKKDYYIRINCPAFADFRVTAENEKEAIEKAESEYNCDGARGEYCETLDDPLLAQTPQEDDADIEKL